jgi:hypothetical protein
VESTEPAALPTQAPATSTPVPTAAIPPTVTPLPVKAFTRLEIQAIEVKAQVWQTLSFIIETDGSAGNPFDPSQVDLWVRLTSPQGASIRVPAFWYQDFDPASLRPVGEPGWRARFTPAESGQWSAQAELTSPTQLVSAPLSFSVTDNPQARGFLRVSQNDPHYMEFDDGSFYFPIGLNVSWAGSQVLDDYQRWLDRLAQNGGNYIRVWMASWSFGLEWKDTGLGNYSDRLLRAWLLDQVFEMAEERGIIVMLCLVNHGAFSDTTNPEWGDNPYNSALGGPLQDPSQFVNDTAAKDLFKRRIRYIAARWASSPSLGMWEWWNEVNWTPIDAIQLEAWISEMSAEMDRYDPYRHLKTTSWSTGANNTTWRLPELDLAQQHAYTTDDPMSVLPATFKQFQSIAPDKPFLMGEYGSSADGEDAPYNTGALHLHNGLWAAPFSGYAGTAMYWWWDTYIDPQNLWVEYRGISAFMQNENLEGAVSRRVASTPEGAWALLLSKPGRVLGWVRATANNLKDSQAAYEKALRKGKVPADWKYELPELNGLTLSIDGLDPGDYQIQWFSTLTGEPVSDPELISVAGGSVALPLPALQKDLAFKLWRND